MYHCLPEYEALLSITDGIRDNDLRCQGVCGLDGIRGKVLQFDQLSHKLVRKDLPHVPVLQSKQGWKFLTGFMLSPLPFEQPIYVGYVYCARDEKYSQPIISGQRERLAASIEPHERVWKWRLYYKEDEKPRLQFLWPMVFEDLLDWLRFYQEWWDRQPRVFVEWEAECIRMVDILYPDNPDQLGDTDSTADADESLEDEEWFFQQPPATDE